MAGIRRAAFPSFACAAAARSSIADMSSRVISTAIEVSISVDPSESHFWFQGNPARVKEQGPIGINSGIRSRAEVLSRDGAAGSQESLFQVMRWHPGRRLAPETGPQADRSGDQRRPRASCNSGAASTARPANVAKTVPAKKLAGRKTCSATETAMTARRIHIRRFIASSPLASRSRRQARRAVPPSG